MKNQDIEQAVFEEFLKVSQLTIENLSLSDHPDLTFQFGEKKVGVELAELLDEQEKSVDKIRTALKSKINKIYSLPDHEIWLLLYKNHAPMDNIGKIFDEMPQIEQLVADFLSIKKDINRVIVFEVWSKTIPLEMIRS